MNFFVNRLKIAISKLGCVTNKKTTKRKILIWIKSKHLMEQKFENYSITYMR